MKTVYSDNDLLLFLYDEMPFEKANELVTALSQDEELLARYEYFQRTAGAVQAVSFEPSAASIDLIMDEVGKVSSAKSNTEIKKGGSWRTALLTGICVLAFGVTAFIGASLTHTDTPTSASASTVQVANDGLWDDDSFSSQIESIEIRTKALQDPIL